MVGKYDEQFLKLFGHTMQQLNQVCGFINFQSTSNSSTGFRKVIRTDEKRDRFYEIDPLPKIWR